MNGIDGRGCRRIVAGFTVWIAALGPVLPAVAFADGPADPRGFLYAKITARSGTVYEGRIRWDGDEAFWGDLFESVKKERPHFGKLPPERRSEPFKIFGITIGSSSDNTRGFFARFGDIRRIEVGQRGEAVVTMKNGTAIEVKGGSDVGRPITVRDPGFDEIELRWKEIRSIELLPTPADLEVGAGRLYGTVETSAGTFQGFVQWDRDECLTTDRLDGDLHDGEVSVRMGKIRVIEKRTHSSARVILVNGSELALDDTNDVNEDNRGIVVEDPRFGRVAIDWDVFQRLELSAPEGSGPPYEDFAPGKALRGKVTTTGGESHSGRLIWDLDESEDWELLSGKSDQVEYFIPFALVAEVVPDGNYHSRVILTGGEKLVLENSADVDEDNDGLVVDPGDGGEPVYVPWEKVARVELAH